MITKLTSSVHNELALRQFVSVGILLQFESLISCHGDELGMLEDMDTSMHDLASVRFVITSRNDASTTTAVSVSGSRSVTFTHFKWLVSMVHCYILAKWKLLRGLEEIKKFQ